MEACAEKGIVVFNTPGANANAVKELVIAGLLLASRNIVDGINWAKTLVNTDAADVAKQVEKGKAQFSGCEIEGKRLGVIGLGAIGAIVANAARSLGMEVLGFDKFLTVDAAGVCPAVSSVRKTWRKFLKPAIISPSMYLLPLRRAVCSTANLSP